MKRDGRKQQIEAVKGWWNSSRIVKWDKHYDDYDIHSMRYLNSRQEKVLKMVDELNLPKSAKVLELGYGAGQTALKLGQRGFEVHGVDISEKLCEFAQRRCEKNLPDGKFFFKTGNIESHLEYKAEEFDLVVIVGALQYLYDHNSCLKEVYHVLKPGGFFIVAQKNAFCLSHLTTIREFARRCVYFFLREEYELFPSFKSILVDSKLGLLFKRFENSSFMNSPFMLKGYDNYKYKLNKKLISYTSLKSDLNSIGLTTFKADGAYYNISEQPIYYELNLKVDDFLEKLSRNGFKQLLFPFARTIIILSKKNKSF